MATTSQVTSYRSAGQPDDAVGAIGDTCFDTVSRITWVKQSGNTWAGGAYSNIGPTGPAQLSGTGAPASGFGQIGNGYTDQASGLTYLKSSSGWAQVGSNLGPAGAKGDAGPSMLSSQSAGCGYDFSCTVTTTTTPILGAIPGTTQSRSFTPTYGTALMGLTYTNPGAAQTITLYNQTTSTAVFTMTATGNATSNAGQFAVNAYPMAAGNTYVWQVTSSASQTAALWVQPIYLWPAVTPSYNVSSIGTATSGATRTFSGTTYVLNAGGTSVSQSFKFSKACSIYSLTAISTNSAALTATLTINGSGSNPIAVTIPANATTSFGPYTLGAYPLVANTQYYWGITGSGSGQLVLDAQIVTSVS